MAEQKNIKLADLKMFCSAVLEQEGMCKEYARICAEVLSETDAFGTYSHGTKNLHNYIRKIRAGGIEVKAKPEVVSEGPAYALVDAHNALGLISSYKSMELACDKAAKTGIAIVCVKNSSHFGAAGYYANMAAKRDMVGLSMSNVDPNMTIPGARGMVLGNNPLAYAAPAISTPSVFLDIAMSNVASLKVIQARKDGISIPNTWIVDREGLPTTDPSHYPEEGAMQPMAAHKGYGLALMVEILTGVLSGGGMSMMGEIVSWCFDIEKPNNVCHTFIAIDIDKFIGKKLFKTRVENMIQRLRKAPKAKGAERILVPGEIEWNNHAVAETQGLTLPADVTGSLMELSEESGILINWS